MPAAGWLRALSGLAALLLAAAAGAQDAERQHPRQPLPRVLLIGDRSFQSHYGNTPKALKDRAEVVRSALGHLHTGAALERFEELLQDEKWDLICFNFGLGDLMCRDPRTKAIRAMSSAAGGVPVTNLDDYGRNLDALIARFRATGAKLIWLPTLPLSPQQRNSALVASAIDRYNSDASERMHAQQVAVVDVHSQIMALLAEAKNARGVDRLHNEILKRDLSAPLAARILELTKP